MEGGIALRLPTSLRTSKNPAFSVLKALSMQDAKPRNHRGRGIALITQTKNKVTKNLNTNNKLGGNTCNTGQRTNFLTSKMLL